MSLHPVSPIVMSKLKYHILNRLKDKPQLQPTLDLLGPYPTFILKCNYRKISNGETHEMEGDELAKFLNVKESEFDCCETVLNLHKRLKDMVKDYYRDAGVARLSIQYKYPDDSAYSDALIDEVPLNISYESIQK